MRVAVVGLGHVGSVIAASLLRGGHSVVGLDSDPDTAMRFSSGRLRRREPGVSELVAAGLAEDRFSVTTDFSATEVDAVFVCAPTRGREGGDLDTSDLVDAAQAIGSGLARGRRGSTPLQIVFCSTMAPGTMNSVVLPELERTAGEAAGGGYEVAFWPEFSREGSALSDRLAPARIVIGERFEGAATVLRELLKDFPAPTFYTSFEVAELVKLADNAFHALKVSFANEIGRLAIGMGLPAQLVSEIFVADSKLNISDAYLRPGASYGGPCLSKDVRALASHMHRAGVSAPVIAHIEESNEAHTRFVIGLLGQSVKPGARVLMIGLSFKAGVDDLRSSPFVRLAHALMGFGCELSIYDPDIDEAALTGGDADLSALSPRFVTSLKGGEWDRVVVCKGGESALSAVLDGTPVLRLDRL